MYGMSFLLLVLGIVLFIGLVVVHELGHFIVARRNGVVAEEFGIFFPPALIKKKTKSGLVLSLNALPLGGFVRLRGEHDADTEKGSFGAASVWVKTKIMVAGVAMNLITALVLFTIIAVIGMPVLIPNQFKVNSDTKVVSKQLLLTGVQAGSPADKAGLKSEDLIVAIGVSGQTPTTLKSASELPALTKKYAGQKVNIYYKRGGNNYVATTTLLATNVVTTSQKAYVKKVQSATVDCANIPLPKGYLGVSPPQEYVVQKSGWSAPVTAVGLSAQMTALTFQGLGHALAGLGRYGAGLVTGNSVARQNGQCQASSQVTGPIGIFEIFKSGSLLGYQFILFIVAYISLVLAVMNLLPIPALDGGRLWLMLATRGVKRPLTPEKEELINAIGFFVLIGLMILITINDVQNFNIHL